MKISKLDDRLFSFMTLTKKGKKMRVSWNHVKMKIPEDLIELCEGKYPLHYW